MRVGILSIQGDVTEHLMMMEDVVRDIGRKGSVIEVKTRDEIHDLDALVIPGGESTTIGKLTRMYGLDREINRLVRKGIPVMGTCAGLVLLAKEGNNDVKKTGQPLLGLMSMRVRRNAFGRQRESFEADLRIKRLGKEPYHSVFIRAPAIEKVWGNTEILAEFEGKGVLAIEGNLMAVAFHPELSSDLRLHKYFLRLVR